MFLVSLAMCLINVIPHMEFWAPWSTAQRASNLELLLLPEHFGSEQRIFWSDAKLLSEVLLMYRSMLA